MKHPRVALTPVFIGLGGGCVLLAMVADQRTSFHRVHNPVWLSAVPTHLKEEERHV